MFLATILFAFLFFAPQMEAAAQTQETKAPNIHIKNYYSSIKISSKSAYVFDYTDKRPLFKLNGDSPRPIASLAKIMSVPLALELLGNNSTVAIPQNIDLANSSDYSLKIGAKWNTQKLADFTLIGSSNAGAEALEQSADVLLKSKNSSVDFINLMNTKAIQIGLLHTKFLNTSGLDISKTQPGAISTAHDMITLAGAMLPKYPELLSETIKTKVTFNDLDGKSYVLTNSDSLPAVFPSIILSKTGYTNLAGGNLLIVYQSHNKTIGICILGSILKDRFADIVTLKNATEKYLNTLPS